MKIMVSITIPTKMHEEIDALIQAGYYDNRSELVREALRLFFAQKPEVRLVAAIELYKKGKTTISRTAEIAGISFESMKSILADEGLLQRGREGGEKETKVLEEMVS